MTKTPMLDQYFVDLTGQKLALTTANIADGIKDRLKKKNSITPKQASWLVDRLTKEENLSTTISAEIIAVMERGTLDDQKMAEQSVRARLIDQPVEAKAEHFNSLFDTETKELVRQLDVVTEKLKQKIGA